MVLTKNPCDKASTKCFVLLCNRQLIVLTVKSPDREISVFANFLTRDSYVYLDCDNSWNLQHVFQSGACEVSGSPMPGSKNQSLMNNHDFVVVSLRIVTIELWTNENNHTS